MWQRIKQVAFTYLRWPGMLALVVYTGVCGYAAYDSASPAAPERQTNVYPELPHYGSSVNVMGQDSLDKVDRNARSVFWSPFSSLPTGTVVTRPFPQLRTLRIVGTLKNSDLTFLREMPALRGLTILADLQPDSLTPAAALSELRYLRVQDGDSRLGWQYLRQLPQLRTLDVLRATDHGDLFEEISQLPHLTTLIVPGQIALVFEAADWEQLRALPHLRQIYLRGNIGGPDNSRMELDRVQALLPAVKVRPATVSDRKTRFWRYAVVLGCVATTVVLVQLQSQFSHPGSRLIPNYVRYHLGVAVAILIASTAVQITLQSAAGSPVLASVAGSLLTPGLIWIVLAFTARSDRSLCVAFTPHSVVAFGMCFSIWPILGVSLLQSDLDWFLSGRQPGLACVVIALCLASIGIVLRQVPRLSVALQEIGAGQPPLGLSFAAWKTWLTDDMTRHLPKKNNAWLNNKATRLDRLLAEPGRRGWSQVWIAANPLNGRMLALVFIIGAPLLMGFWRGIEYLEIITPDGRHAPSRILPLIFVYWLDVATLMLLQPWSDRRLLLGYESLRPLPRRELVRQLFRAVATDIRPLLLCHTCVVGLLVAAYWNLGVPPLFWPTVIGFCVFRALCIYDTILFFMTVRRKWLLMPGAFLVYLLTSLGNIYIGLSAFRSDAWIPVVSFTVILAGCIIAGGSYVWLKRYWQKIELA